MKGDQPSENISDAPSAMERAMRLQRAVSFRQGEPLPQENNITIPASPKSLRKALSFNSNSQSSLQKVRSFSISGGTRRGLFSETVVEEVRIFLTILEDGVKVKYHSIKHGPPRNALLKLDSHNSKFILTYGRRKITTLSIPFSSLSSVVKGRETTCFKRTAKYTPAEFFIDSYLSTFSLVYATEAASLSTLDVELPLEQGSTARRDRLVDGFNSSLGLPIVDRPPGHLAVDPTGPCDVIYNVMYGNIVSAVIYACIIISVIVMALSSPLLEHDPDMAIRYASEIVVLDTVESIVTWIFTVEVFLKIIALESFIVYIKDPWNFLDCFVVVSGWMTTFMTVSSETNQEEESGGLNFTAFRALRALRVLRTFKVFPGIIEIVETFIKTLGTVGQGVVIYFYFLTLFTVCSMELWSRTLFFSCVHNTSGKQIVPAVYCSSDVDTTTCPPNFHCSQTISETNERGFHSFRVALTTLYGISVRAGLGAYVNGLVATGGTGHQILVILFFLFFNLFVSGMVFSIFIAIIRSTFAATRRQTLQRKKQLREKIALLPESSSLAAKYRSKASTGKIAPAPSTVEARDEILALSEGSKESLKTGFAWLIDQTWFDTAVSMAILLNCICFGLVYYEQPQSRTDALKLSETVFAFLFLVEVVVKVLGLGGFRNYICNYWNCFDFLIVVSSLFDVFASGFVNFSLLRMFRLLRVVRLLRRNPEIVKIVTALIASVPALSNLILFCGLLFGVFAILGMQLYGVKMGLPDQTVYNATTNIPKFSTVYNPPRANFDSFPSAMLSLFQMMSGGAQWPIYYNCLETDMGSTAPVFFLLFGVFSNFIVLNFMVVIIMSNFAMKAQDIENLRKQREDAVLSELRKKQRKQRLKEQAKQQKAGSTNPLDIDTRAEVDDGDGDNSESLPNTNFAWVSYFLSKERQEYALLVLSPTNKLRMGLSVLSAETWFESLIIFAIIGSSVSLTFESPVYENNETVQEVLKTLDLFFLGVFTFEFVVKVGGFGFIFPSLGYLKDNWNRLDFVVLFVSYLGLAGGGGSAGKMLRIGRILRPLRMINRNEGLKVIVDALIRAVRPVSYTMVLLFVYFFSFAIIGMEFYLGLFWKCNDTTVSYRHECVGHYLDPGDNILKPRIWANPPFSFDSIGESFSTLFETIALKGWPEKLWAAIDTTEIGAQPKRANSFWNALYLIFFIYFGSFFMMKLFVGVIVGTFRKFSGTLLLTANQLQWLEMKRVMNQMTTPVKPPPESSSTLKKFCYEITTNDPRKQFDLFSVVVTLTQLFLVILIQMGLLSESVQLPLHIFFTFVQFGVLFVRVYAIGLKRLCLKQQCDPVDLRSYWTIDFPRAFELLVFVAYVVFPIVGISTKFAVVMKSLDFTQTIRVVEVKFPKMKQIIQVLSECILAMCNVTLIFFMLVFIYAILGMQLFSRVKHGVVLGSTASFHTFQESLLTVFQIAAGDNWINIMRDCSVEQPYCTFIDENNTDCGSKAAARVYFFSLYFLMFGVFLNLYVATIVDAYESKTKTAATFRFSFSKQQFDRFRDVWKRYDPQAIGRISVKCFRGFFFDVGVPFSPVEQTQVLWSSKQKNLQYNQARFEIFPLISTRFLCSLPSTEVSTSKDNEPSIGFFEVLQVLIMLNVDVGGLSPQERVLRVRKQTIITNNLAAMTLQAFVRGISFRCLFKALLKARKKAKENGEMLDTASEEELTVKVQEAYKELYGCKFIGKSFGFSLNVKDEVAFDNVTSKLLKTTNVMERDFVVGTMKDERNVEMSTAMESVGKSSQTDNRRAKSMIKNKTAYNLRRVGTTGEVDLT